jgi:hypothetical protein
LSTWIQYRGFSIGFEAGGDGVIVSATAGTPDFSPSTQAPTSGSPGEPTLQLSRELHVKRS